MVAPVWVLSDRSVSSQPLGQLALSAWSGAPSPSSLIPHPLSFISTKYLHGGIYEVYPIPHSYAPYLPPYPYLSSGSYHFPTKYSTYCALPIPNPSRSSSSSSSYQTSPPSTLSLSHAKPSTRESLLQSDRGTHSTTHRETQDAHPTLLLTSSTHQHPNNHTAHMLPSPPRTCQNARYAPTADACPPRACMKASKASKRERSSTMVQYVVLPYRRIFNSTTTVRPNCLPELLYLPPRPSGVARSVSNLEGAIVARTEVSFRFGFDFGFVLFRLLGRSAAR